MSNYLNQLEYLKWAQWNQLSSIMQIPKHQNDKQMCGPSSFKSNTWGDHNLPWDEWMKGKVMYSSCHITLLTPVWNRLSWPWTWQYSKVSIIHGTCLDDSIGQHSIRKPWSFTLASHIFPLIEWRERESERELEREILPWWWKALFLVTITWGARVVLNFR